MYHAQEAKDQSQFSLNHYNIAKHSGPLFTVSSSRLREKWATFLGDVSKIETDFSDEFLMDNA
jgi:hypothetical protein